MTTSSSDAAQRGMHAAVTAKQAAGIPDGACPGCNAKPATGQKWCQSCIDAANAEAAAGVPEAAVTAAAVALHKRRCNCAIPHRDYWPGYSLLDYEHARHAVAAAAPLIAIQAATTERERVRSVLNRDKIEWIIHLLDLVDELMVRHGLDTGSEVQDDLRTLAGLLDGDSHQADNYFKPGGEG